MIVNNSTAKNVKKNNSGSNNKPNEQRILPMNNAEETDKVLNELIVLHPGIEEKIIPAIKKILDLPIIEKTIIDQL